MKKKFLAGILIFAMVMACFVITPKNADVAEAAVADSIIYQEMTDEVERYIGKGIAPSFEGVVVEGGVTSLENNVSEDDLAWNEDVVGADGDYLFGGWYAYTYSNRKYVLYGESGKINADDYANEEFELVFAKWVPASVARVKAQINSDVTGSSTSATTRIISAVDCLDYNSVGFEITLINKETNNKRVLDIDATTKVYSALVANGASKDAPSIFGSVANYFSVLRLTNILAGNFDDIIYVKPYWVTYDGTTVYGLPKHVHVEDGINNYISVPINLTDISESNPVAAGVFEISYPEGLSLVDEKVEIGHVFGELEYADKGGKIKFAANVSDISKDAIESDIYVNLRFILDTNNDGVGEIPVNNSYKFNITPESEDFCDKTESKKNVNVWDVLY